MSEVNLAFLGDIALNGLFTTEQEENKNRFEDISPYLHQLDVIFANLETPIKAAGDENTEKIGKGVIHHTTKDVLKYVLPTLNISAVSLANNHIFDYREMGVRKTIECLDELGIKHTGAGFKKEHTEPALLDIHGLRIAFLAYVSSDTNPMTANANIYINIFSEDKIICDIKNVSCICDLTIVSLHWGNDYSYYPTIYQKQIGRKIINAGANVIMGHHTHTMQPYECYNGGLIFYSLGQLCYGDNVWEGELRALKRKTKRAAFPVFDEKLNLDKFITTKELKGNYIKLIKWNYKLWSMIHMEIAKLMFRYKSVKLAVSFKEAFIDRIIEYFFGYYRNPFVQLFKIFKNVHKIKLLKRDFNNYFLK